MNTFKRILVPTDFGEASEEALNVACDLAKSFGSMITLMHIWTVPTPIYAEGIALPYQEIEAAAREALGKEADRVKSRGVELRTALVPGIAWQRIVGAVKEHGHDLVVIGTHGRRGVPRFFLGSVAEMVVRTCPVPVLSIHAASAKTKS